MAASARCAQKNRSRAGGGIEITADMYTYTAGATGLDASMPPWCRKALQAWRKRLQDPATASV